MITNIADLSKEADLHTSKVRKIKDTDSNEIKRNKEQTTIDYLISNNGNNVAPISRTILNVSLQMSAAKRTKDKELQHKCEDVLDKLRAVFFDNENKIWFNIKADLDTKYPHRSKVT